MGLIRRLLGLCDTKIPADGTSWEVRDGTVVVDLEKATELRQRGDAVRLEKNGLGGKRILLIHSNDGYQAYINKCTHGGRRLDPLADGESMSCCSLGKTTYDAEGQWVSGPGKKALTKLTVEHGKDSLKIRL
ncbi:MAG: Rieske 2Fe-2S domain-containing protein [Proteobacteria bacterium]|jgi:nitrite reductase/ring-hydroxylating ferredoxin subunit|nr:Rieske 2Fe-2S domain-containing protein [Pseudomonadota bacterium]